MVLLQFLGQDLVGHAERMDRRGRLTKIAGCEEGEVETAVNYGFQTKVETVAPMVYHALSYSVYGNVWYTMV